MAFINISINISPYQVSPKPLLVSMPNSFSSVVLFDKLFNFIVTQIQNLSWM